MTFENYINAIFFFFLGFFFVVKAEVPNLMPISFLKESLFSFHFGKVLVGVIWIVVYVIAFENY